ERFDLIGAVLVTLFASSITRTIALLRIKKLMGVTVRELLPWKSLGSTVAICAMAAVPALLLKSALDAPHLVTLVATGILFTITYYFLLLWLGPMREDEKHMLAQWAWAPLNWVSRIRSKPRELPR